LLFHDNSGYAIVPECYVTRIHRLSCLLIGLNLVVRNVESVFVTVLNKLAKLSFGKYGIPLKKSVITAKNRLLSTMGFKSNGNNLVNNNPD